MEGLRAFARRRTVEGVRDGERNRIGALRLVALCAAGVLGACATDTGPPPVAQPGANPFHIDDATDAPRIGAAAAGTRGGFESGVFRFGSDERRMQAGGREVLAGEADGAAYLHTTDHRIGLMAAQPGRGARTLSYSGRDWYVTCAPGGGARCVVKVATAEVAGREIQDAVRFHVDPTGTEPVRVCLGPEGTSGGTLRLVNARRDFSAGGSGCLKAGDAARVMKALGEGEDFQYRFADASGTDVRGWHPSWGLTRALAFARWLGGRVSGG